MNNKEALRFAERAAKADGLSILQLKSLKKVLSACLKNTSLFPKRKKKSSIPRDKEGIETWVGRYIRAWKKRPSTRSMAPRPKRIDPALEIVTRIRGHLPKADAKKGLRVHCDAMAYENAIGALLEEFVANRLAGHGWHCAWGSTVDKVDFVGPRNRLLQIKNGSTTENSSSRTVRDGTTIEIWWRRDSNNGKDNWSELRKVIGRKSTTGLSETNFLKFVEAWARKFE